MQGAGCRVQGAGRRVQGAGCTLIAAPAMATAGAVQRIFPPENSTGSWMRPSTITVGSGATIVSPSVWGVGFGVEGLRLKVEG